MGSKPRTSGTSELETRKGKLFCPGCEKEVEFRDYYTDVGFVGEAVAAITNFIECTNCGYYGLPIIIRKVPKNKTGKKKK